MKRSFLYGLASGHQNLQTRGPRQDSEYVGTEDHEDCPKTLPRSNPTVQGREALSLGAGLLSRGTGPRGPFCHLWIVH